MATRTDFLVQSFDGRLLVGRQKTSSERMSMHIPFDFLGRCFLNLGNLGEQYLGRGNRCMYSHGIAHLACLLAV